MSSLIVLPPLQMDDSSDHADKHEAVCFHRLLKETPNPGQICLLKKGGGRIRFHQDQEMSDFESRVFRQLQESAEDRYCLLTDEDPSELPGGSLLSG